MNEAVKKEDTSDELDSWFDETEEDGVEGQSAAEDSQEQESGSEEGTPEEEAPDNEDLENDAGEESPPSDQGTSAEPKAKAKDDPFAFVDGLPPEHKERIEALVRRDQSNTGRVAALRSRLDQLEAEREAQRTAGKGTPTEEGMPTAKEVEDMSDEEFDQFLEDFPTVARNVEKLISRELAKERKEILDQVRPIREEAEQRKILEQKQTLRKEAEKLFNTEETGIHLEDVLQSQEWHDWLAAQPQNYQSFVTTAQDAESALVALRDFDRYARETLAPSESNEGPKETSRADQTAARRKQSLAGDTPSSRTAAIDDSSLGDYEAYFEEAVREG
jgi:hypothetical protein